MYHISLSFWSGIIHSLPVSRISVTKSIIPYRRRHKYFHCLGKVKVVPVLVMKESWGSRGMTPLILNFRTRCRSVLNFTPRTISSTGGKYGTNWIDSWVDPRADPDPLEKRRIEPRFLGCLALSLVTPLTTTDLLNSVARSTALCFPVDVRNENLFRTRDNVVQFCTPLLPNVTHASVFLKKSLHYFYFT